ncbi:hypothetical protein [Nitriliruptor alkaliphilus]|uniref:hypothetical protein n=1 Tax=Nitriliruptor alkaliphilus TaxID=427918 RepID=UPI0006980ADB|nr:hypothetical protein [Nitriliruptor alkaliphilus]
MSTGEGWQGSGGHPLDPQVRWMLRVALVIFAYTIVIGILNGLDLVEFSRQQLLSHLHGGTLGWMTLAILGVTLWLFGAGESSTTARSARVLAWAAPVSIAAYVLAFATTTGGLRPVAGTATLLVLIGAAVWAFRRAPSVTLSVPHLFVLLGLTSSVIGGTFGVINGLAIAFDWTWVPASFFGAHPGTMEVGFIIPVAMGLAEWGLRRGRLEPRVTRAGRIQVGLMFLAFAWVLGFTLAELDEVAGLGIVFAIVGLGFFYARLGGIMRTTSVAARSAERHALAGGVLLGVTIVYIFVVIQMAGGDFMQVPRGQLIAFIHLMGVGATTNALLAFVVHLSRRVSPATMVDDVIFWGVNVGVLGFVVALTTDVRAMIVVFVPVMGLGLLTAIVAHVGPLGRGPTAVPPPAVATPEPLG